MATVQEATVKYTCDMAFVATAGSGHVVWMDADASVGGENGGFRPTEMILMGLGCCTGMDVISILHKMRQAVTDYRVEVHGTKRDEHPQIFTDLTVEHVVSGHDLDPAMVEKAVRLSAEKYCAVSAMLGQAVRLRHTWRIVPAAEPSRPVAA